MENILYIEFYLLYIELLGNFLENYLINSAELILCLKRKGNLISAYFYFLYICLSIVQYALYEKRKNMYAAILTKLQVKTT